MHDERDVDLIEQEASQHPTVDYLSYLTAVVYVDQRRETQVKPRQNQIQSGAMKIPRKAQKLGANEHPAVKVLGMIIAVMAVAPIVDIGWGKWAIG